MGQDETSRRETAAAVEELLRVNAELAAEIRRLSLGEVERPRSSRVPAARQISKIVSERDRALQQLSATETELDRLRRSHEELSAIAEERLGEIVLLRSGWKGLLRRARMQLLRR